MGKRAGNPPRRRRASRGAARILLEAAAALLLLCGGLLLAGHCLAASPQRMEQLAAGAHGPTLAAWGRCVLRMRLASEGTGAWGAPGGASWRGGMQPLGRQLAVESACAVSAVRREAVLSWAAVQPGVVGWLRAAGEKSRQSAVASGKHGGAALRYMSTAARPVLDKVSSLTQEQCPACVRAMDAAARQSERLVPAWFPLGGGDPAHKHQHSLYHGWLQSSGHVSAAFAQICNAAKAGLQQVAGAWSTRLAPHLASACEPVWAVLTAAHDLLKQSADAVLPEQEPPALGAEGSSPEQATGSAKSNLAAAGSQVKSWVAGMLRRGGIEPAAEPVEKQDNEEAERAQKGVDSSVHDDEEQQPPHMHVLRWPLPGGLEGDSSQDEAAEPAAQGVAYPAPPPNAQPEESASELGGGAAPLAPEIQQQGTIRSSAPPLEGLDTVVEGSASSAEGVLQQRTHAKGSKLSGMQDVSSTGSEPATLPAHANINASQPQHATATEEPVSSWPGGDELVHLGDIPYKDADSAVPDGNSSLGKQPAAEERPPDVQDVPHSDTQPGTGTADFASVTSQEAESLPARTPSAKQRATGSDVRGWASTLGWSALSALVIGAVCAAAAAAISPEAVLLTTPGPTSSSLRQSAQSEREHQVLTAFWPVTPGTPTGCLIRNTPCLCQSMQDHLSISMEKG